jgi:hypothetical protein
MVDGISLPVKYTVFGTIVGSGALFFAGFAIE